MVTTKPTSTFTFADLLALPDDSPIYDVLGGEFVLRNAPDINHALARMELGNYLFAAQEAGYGYVFGDTTAVALDYPARGEAAEHVSHPDLCFVRRAREAIIGDRAIEGVPDLVIEILSPSTRDEHARGGKLWQSYEDNGVPLYWTVDNARRTIAERILIGEPYQAGHFGPATLFGPGDSLICRLFPALPLSVARVFRNVRARRPGRGPAAGGASDG